METKEEFLTFLNNKKHLIGMSDWQIFLKEDSVNMDKIATIGVDIYEKTLTVELSIEFDDFSPERKKNVLMHELVHAKISAYNQEIREIVAIREEHLVNDLTRGYEDLL